MKNLVGIKKIAFYKPVIVLIIKLADGQLSAGSRRWEGE
jgi:hypothetical protein